MSSASRYDPISPSAKGVAYLRSLDVDVSHDRFACCFADEEGRQAAENWLEVYPGVGRQICVRSRYIEDSVGRGLERENGQVISLAAGLGTYPYRARWMSRVSYYAEVDLPGMAAFKKETMHRLMEKGAIPKPKIPIKHLGLDVADASLMKQLGLNGWDPSGKTVFIVEGVSYYLSSVAINALMENIANASCPGSIVIMDYFPKMHSRSDPFKGVMGSIERHGEITCFCPSAEQLSKLFHRYRIVSDVPAPEIERKYYEGNYCVVEMANLLVAKLSG